VADHGARERIAMGAAVGGSLIDASDWRAAVTAGVIATACGGLVALARRHTLRAAVAAAATA
jgi:hypothetical protein